MKLYWLLIGRIVVNNSGVKHISISVVPLPRQLVADLSLQRPGFDSRPVCFGFVVKKVALDKVSLHVHLMSFRLRHSTHALYTYFILPPSTIYNLSNRQRSSTKYCFPLSCQFFASLGINLPSHTHQINSSILTHWSVYEIGSSHCGKYKNCNILGCDAV